MDEFVKQFISIIKNKAKNKYIGSLKFQINDKRWAFAKFKDSGLVLSVKHRGTTWIYTEFPMELDDIIELQVVSLHEFIVSELISQHVKKEELEKILFSVL